MMMMISTHLSLLAVIIFRRNANHVALHYAVFCTLLLFPVPQAPISSFASCPNHQSVCVKFEVMAAANTRITGVMISPQPDQEGNKLQRQKILMFIYPMYYHNWKNIKYYICIYVYIYKTRLTSKEIFSPSNKIHREVGRAKNLSEPRYYLLRSSIVQSVHIATFRKILILLSTMKIWATTSPKMSAHIYKAE